MYTLTPLCRIFRGYPAQKEVYSLHATPATSASGIVRVIPDTDRLVVNFSLFSSVIGPPRVCWPAIQVLV